MGRWQSQLPRLRQLRRRQLRRRCLTRRCLRRRCLRWPCLTLCCSVLLVGVAACSNDSAEGVPSVADASVGDCYSDVGAAPVHCNDRHIAQTVYVSDAPTGGDQAVALLPCREAQAKFLGQDFNTRLAVELWVASDGSWYRCDVLLRNSTRAGQGYQALTGSLKGVLRRGTAIDLQACLNAAYDPTIDQTYVSCRKPHVSRELTVAPAIGTLDEPLPEDVAQRAVSACNATAAADGQLLPDRMITAFYPETADAWASGERTADCWVTATEGTLPALTVGQR